MSSDFSLRPYKMTIENEIINYSVMRYNNLKEELEQELRNVTQALEAERERRVELEAENRRLRDRVDAEKTDRIDRDRVERARRKFSSRSHLLTPTLPTPDFPYRSID